MGKIMYQLRPYQSEAVEKGIAFLKSSEQGGAIIVAPTAAGKSLYIASISDALEGNTLILQPSLEVLQSNLEKAEAMGITDIGVYSASADRKDIGKLTFATIKSIIHKKELFDYFQHLIIDECFVAGTKVDDKNIEDIKIGDYVSSFNHEKGLIEKKKVIATMANKIKNDLILTHLQDEIIISTYSHPFYVLGKGYVPAYKLLKGDKLYANRTLCKKNKSSTTFLYSLWKRVKKTKSVAGLSVQKERTDLLFRKMLMGISRETFFGKNVEKKPILEFGDRKKDGSNLEKNRTQTTHSGWKWAWHDCSAKEFIGVTWRRMVSRACCPHKKKKLGGLSASLQSGFSESSDDACSRNRWWESLLSFNKKKGQEKEGAIGIVRVESVEIYEQGSNFGYSTCERNNFVYNLEVEGNNNYFANGVLVHNCHACNAKGGQYEELINYMGGKVLGLSATPYRLHAYNDFKTGQLSVVAKFLHRTRPRLFSKIIHITQIQDLYNQGFLCPIEYKLSSDYNHSEIRLNSTGMDFDENSLFEYNKSHSVIETTSKIALEEKFKHALVFMSSVEEATSLANNLKARGISSEIISAKTPKKERADILRQFKEGKIRVVTNFGTLTTGYDFPELDCVILGRPTQSVALYYQMVGRGIRIAPGKEKTKIIDICGNVKRFGKIENFEIVEEKPGMHRLRSDTSYLSGYDFYNNIDIESTGYSGLREVEWAGHDNIVQFGKWKGTHITKIPNDYLYWVCENLTGKWQQNFKKEKERREESALKKRMELVSPF